MKQEQQKEAKEQPIQPTVTQPVSVQMEPQAVANCIRVGTDVTWERVNRLATLDGMTTTQFICAVLATDPTREDYTTRVITVESADGAEVVKTIKSEVYKGGLVTATHVINLLFCLDSAVTAGLPVKGAGVLVKELASLMTDRERRELFDTYVRLAEDHPTDRCADVTLSPGAFELDMQDGSLANVENLMSMLHNLYQSALFEGLRPVQPKETKDVIHVISSLFDTAEEAKFTVSALASKYEADVLLVDDAHDSDKHRTFLYLPMTENALAMFEDFKSGESTSLLDSQKHIIFVAGEVVSNTIRSITDHRFQEDGLSAKKGTGKLRFSDELPTGQSPGGAVSSIYGGFIPFTTQLHFARVEGGAQDAVANSGVAPPMIDLVSQEPTRGGAGQNQLYPAVPCAPSTVSSASILDLVDAVPSEVYTNVYQRGAGLHAQQQRVEAQQERIDGSSAAQWNSYQPNMQAQQQQPVNLPTPRGDSAIVVGDRIADCMIDDFSTTVTSAIRALAFRPEDYRTFEGALRLLFVGRPREKISLQRAGSAREALNRYPEVLKAMDLKQLSRTAGTGNSVGNVFSKAFDLVSRKVTVKDSFLLLMISARQLQKNCSLFTVEEDNGETVISANSV